MTIERIEGKIDSLAGTVTTLSSTVLTMCTRMENYPEEVKHIDDLEVRLTALETLEIRKVTERLQHIESVVSSFKGWIAGATAVAACAGGLVVYLVSQMVASVPGV